MISQNLDGALDDSLGDWLDKRGSKIVLKIKYPKKGRYCTSSADHEADDVYILEFVLLFVIRDCW